MVDFGKTDIKDVPGKIKEEVKKKFQVQSNIELMENTLSEGKASMDEFLGDMGEEVKLYREAKQARSKAETQRLQKLSQFTADFKKAETDEERQKLREEAQSLLPEKRTDFVDEIDRLENEVVKAATARVDVRGERRSSGTQPPLHRPAEAR